MAKYKVPNKILRTPKRRILIVCEGEKTEPYYFDAMKQAMSLSSVTVKAARNSAPISVVESALEYFNDDGDFDAVYCVIDRDSHTTFGEAMDRIRALRNSKQAIDIVAIPSYPCFEYWLLLHFQYTRKPFVRTGNKSACGVLTSELKTYPGFEHYDHGFRDSYKQTQSKLQDAIRNAEKADLDANKTNESNPSTKIHLLVRVLEDLAQS
jgi:hypothetical protein